MEPTIDTTSDIHSLETPEENDGFEGESDEEIPHLLKPSSDDDESGDDEVNEGYLFHLRCRTPPAFNTADYFVNTSPVSSLTTPPLPNVSFSSSEDGSASTSKGSPSISTGRSRSSGRRSIRRKRSDKGRVLNTEDLRPPRLKLYPRMEDRHPHSISPVTIRSVSPTLSQDGFSVINHSPRNIKARKSRSRDTSNQISLRNDCASTSSFISSSSSKPPPFPTISTSSLKYNRISHRRSVSLNLPPCHSSNGTRRSIIKHDDMRLSTLKEEGRVEPYKNKLPNQISTIEKSKGSVVKSRAVNSLHSHRRCVSFPDEVLHKDGRNLDGSVANSSPSQSNPKYSPYTHDITLESDDPALFSLIETTQSRCDGRVCVAADVVTPIILASPMPLSLYLKSPSTPTPSTPVQSVSSLPSNDESISDNRQSQKQNLEFMSNCDFTKNRIDSRQGVTNSKDEQEGLHLQHRKGQTSNDDQPGQGSEDTIFKAQKIVKQKQSFRPPSLMESFDSRQTQSYVQFDESSRENSNCTIQASNRSLRFPSNGKISHPKYPRKRDLKSNFLMRIRKDKSKEGKFTILRQNMKKHEEFHCVVQ